MTPPEPVRADLPEIGVRTFAWVLSYFKETRGRAALEKIWAEERMPLSLGYCENTDNFVSLDFLERSLEVLVSRSGNPNLMAEAGKNSVSPAALGFAYYLLRGLGSPQFAYRKTLEMTGTYNRVGTFNIEHLDAVTLEVTYRSQRPERTPLVCQGRRVSLAAFPTIWGLKEASVKELSCQAKGDVCCRYRLTWENTPPSNWRYLVGACVGAVAGVLLSYSAAPNGLVTVAAA